jgi:hypothetical protein
MDLAMMVMGHICYVAVVWGGVKEKLGHERGKVTL